MSISHSDSREKRRMKTWKILCETDLKSKTPEDILAILLMNRGINDKKEIELFLHPKLEDVTLTSTGIDIEEVRKSLKRIKEALKKNQKIVVFGDYDVDGICATAILFEVFYKKYKNIVPYIPDRFNHGYGLSIKGIDDLLISHPDTALLITVDNGIVAFEAAEYAKEKGIDLIITDHHVKSEKIPAHFSLVHTTNLCGTGIAYLFAKEIAGILEVTLHNKEFLDLVALATIADLVPLTGGNRTLVKFGLEALRETMRPGLLSLFNLARIKQDQIGTYEIGHVIGPRLNAAGRLFSAMDALRLVCTKSNEKAQHLALSLDQTNKERQALTTEHATHAKLSYIASSNASRIVFVHHDQYNEGIIGLVASRLVEEYYLPSFVISRGEVTSKGSARSISGVNIIELIRSVSEHILQAGGHPMAAGFTLETGKIEEFKKALEEKAQEIILETQLERVLTIDTVILFDFVTYAFYKNLELLAPFGMGNFEPVFMSKNVTIEQVKPVGADGKHVKLKLKQKIADQDSKTFDAIAFGFGEKAKELAIGHTVDVVFTVNEDTWMGNNKLQLKIKDIKLSF